MKSILKMVISFVISIILFTLSLCLNNSGEELLGSLSMVLGIVFISLFCIILGIKISKKITKENTLLIIVSSLLIYFLMYFSYLFFGDASADSIKNISFIYSNIMLALFYISLLIFILCLAMVFYFWITNNERKKLLKYFFINLLLFIIIVLIGLFINESLSLMLFIWKFLYFTSLVSLATFFFVYIGYKIIFPIEK